MTAVQLVLFGLFIILSLASMVISADVASYGKRRKQLPYPLDMLVAMLEVYGAFWTGRLADVSAERAVLLQYGCMLLVVVLMIALVYVKV